MPSSDFIMQMQPWFGVEEERAVSEYMASGGFITEFKQTALLEQKLASYTGARHCVVVNNGTVSLSLMGLAAGLKPGDQVIVPNYTMIATANAFKMFGVEPVFADVEPDTLCLDIGRVADVITESTKAIVLVTANGRYPASGIDAFEALARAHGILLLEDAAQSLGSYFPDGRHMGTAGKMGSFSFSAPKIISTGQGGCVVTDDDGLAERLRKLKDFGRSGGGNDFHDSLGLNFKFTDLQATVGLAQMEKLDWRVSRKQEIYRRYQKNLAGCDAVSFFQQDLDHTTPWFIDVMVRQRDELVAYLRDQQIGTRVMYPPINRQPAYDIPGVHPVSERIGKDGLWLPSASQLSDSQVDRVCGAVQAFYDS